MRRGPDSRARRSSYSSFQQLVDDWSQVFTVFATETPTEVEITYVELPEGVPEGEGTGSRFGLAAKAYADQTGKRLVVPFYGFFSQIPGFMPFRQPNDEVGFAYDPPMPREAATERVIPHNDPVVPCPTCNTPMVEGACPQCNWSPHNVNIDSDPLSNPPDPTKDLHRGIQARTGTARSLYHGTIIDHLPSIQQHGLISDVGGFTSDAYGFEDGKMDYGGDEPMSLEELGARPAVYMTDKRHRSKALTAMQAAIATKLGKPYQDVSPDDIAQHGLLVKLKGSPGYGSDQTGLEYADGDDYYGERPYTVEPDDWWSEDDVGGPFEYITGPKILQVLQRSNTPHPQGWSPEQGQLFTTKPYYNPDVTDERQQTFSAVIPNHRWAKWFDAVEDL